MDQIVIYEEHEFTKIVQEQNSFFLLKHSLTCPISTNAKHQYDAFSKTANIPVYVLYVQEARALSNLIADHYQVKHESPQVLLFKDNQVVWHDSHGRITEKVLHKEIANSI